jgi:hypothetical protein
MNSTITKNQSGKKNNRNSFQEVWYLKLTDPKTQCAFWLRFSLLSSQNGFKRVAETWAISFQRTSARDVKKMALKQTFDLDAFQMDDPSSIKIGECFFDQNRTRGSIQSKGNSIQWDLTLLAGRPSSFNMVPESLTKLGLARYSAGTLCEELLITGTTQVNGETTHWKQAPGMSGHFRGAKSGHSWVWGQCNTFQDDQGRIVPFIFEGITVKTQFGPISSPKVSSFYFHYQNEDYFFNTLRDAFYLKSNHTLNEWKFQADRNDLSFRGQVRAEHKDFAGLTFEDTNGSYLYCANSELSDMKVLVYRRGKLESTFTATSSAGFEVVDRHKNPYVPLLL